MKKALLLAAMLMLSASVAFSACHAMGPTATGSGNGSNWSNVQAVPATWTMVRGDTYYLEDGLYSPVNFANVAGTTLITVKKATPSDFGNSCGIGTGWNAATMGSGQAHFQGTGEIWTMNISFVTFDGVIGTGTGMHGIWVDTSNVSGGDAIGTNTNGGNLTFQHIEGNTGGHAGVNTSPVYECTQNQCSNVTFRYDYFHDAYEWYYTSFGGVLSNILFEYNYFDKAGSNDPSDAFHSTGFSLADINGVTIRYNVIKNMYPFSSTTYIEPQGGTVDVYGNVFWADMASESTSQGIFALTTTDVCTNCHVYNNTIVGLHNFAGIWCGNTGGQQIATDNNIWKDNPAGAGQITGGGGACQDGGHENLTGSGVTFVNEAGGDFHLTGHTANGGTLASPWNVDPDGVTRGSTGGVWDLGAFQFVNAATAHLAVTVQ